MEGGGKEKRKEEKKINWFRVDGDCLTAGEEELEGGEV